MADRKSARKAVSDNPVHPCSSNAIKLGRRNHELEPKPDREDSLPWKMRRMLQLPQSAAGKFQTTARKSRRNKNKSAGEKNNRPKQTPLFSTRRLVGNVVRSEGMSRPLKPVPVFTQRPNETDARFLGRVNRVTKERLQEFKFEEQYGVDVVRDPVTGKVKLIKQRPSDLADGTLHSQREGTSKSERSRRSEDNEEVEKPARINRKKLRQQKRKQRSENKTDEFSHLRDSVAFGEVVQQPPKLRPPRQPRKPNLSKVEDARTRLVEEERIKAINIYRRLKSSTANSQPVDVN